MRKFITNGAFLGAIFGLIPTLKQSSQSRRPWATVLVWVSWGVSIALAVAAVLDARDEARESAFDED